MKFYRHSGATFYDSINTIYQFINFFLDNKMSIFMEYGAFKWTTFTWWFFCHISQERIFHHENMPI